MEIAMKTQWKGITILTMNQSDKIGPETSFDSEKQEFVVESIDPTNNFVQESQLYDLETIATNISNTFTTKKQNKIGQESKEMEMVHEKQSIQHTH